MSNPPHRNHLTSSPQNQNNRGPRKTTNLKNKTPVKNPQTKKPTGNNRNNEVHIGL
jgi:hypothetical protein